MKLLFVVVAPHIHREDVNDANIKVGQCLRFTVHIDGEPPPQVTWSCDGKTLDSNIVTENKDYITKFFLTKAAR